MAITSIVRIMKIKFMFVTLVTLFAVISLNCMLRFAASEELSVLLEKIRTIEEIDRTDNREEFVSALASSIRFNRIEGVPFRWHLVKMLRRSDGKESWHVMQINMKTFSFRKYDLPEIDTSVVDKLTDHLLNSPPQQVDLIVSQDGKYFLVKVGFGKSHLFESETGKEIDFYKKNNISKTKSDEAMIGFNSKGNIYCGTQSISSPIILRDIKTGEKKEYWLSGVNLPPGTEDIYEHWPGGDFNRNTSGIIYNVLQQSVESPDGRWTVIPATVFQFRNILGFVFICDNEKRRVVAQSFIDMTDWISRDTVFDFSKDSRYLSIINGRAKIQIFDTKNNVFSNQCNTNAITVEADEAPVITTASFLNGNNIGLVFSCIFPANDNRQRTFIWDHDNLKFEKPFWDIEKYIVDDLFVSPDNKYLITSHYNLLPRDRYMHKAEGYVICWDIETKRRLFTLEPKNSFKIYVPPCWSVLEYHCPKDDTSTTTTIYDLETFIKKVNDKNSKRIVFTQNESLYRYWESFDGQYSITARLISIDGVDKTKIDDIDLNKLKDTIITLEKESNKKLIEVTFGNLSKKDQNYLLEQIKKQK